MPRPPEKYQLPPKPSWTEEVLEETGLFVVCGIWMIFAPVVFGYLGKTAAYSDVIVGGLLVLLPAWHIIRRYRDHFVLFFTGWLGLWLIISSFIFESNSKAMVNQIFVGLVVMVLTVRVTYATHARRSK
jgi:hypothetical protein